MTDRVKQLPVILHVGYHKTATTYLQNLVFPDHPELLYPGRPFKSKAISDFFLIHQFTHPLSFDAEALREKFSQAISEWVHAKSMVTEGKKALLVSHESLHSGPEWFGTEVMMMSSRLKQVFPGAKIIIGIRNQRDYIESNYKQYLVFGGKLSYSGFISKSYAFNYGLLPKLFYEKLIAEYQHNFGKENVYVYLLEDFKNNLKNELDNIMQFMNIAPVVAYKTDKLNPGISKFSGQLIRTMNCLMAGDFNEQYYNWMQHRLSFREKFRWKTVRLLRKAETALPLNKKLTDEKMERQFKTMFHEPNKKLSQLLNRDLSKLGYY